MVQFLGFRVLGCIDHLQYQRRREKPLQEKKRFVGPLSFSKKPLQVLRRGFHPGSLHEGGLLGSSSNIVSSASSDRGTTSSPGTKGGPSNFVPVQYENYSEKGSQSRDYGEADQTKHQGSGLRSSQKNIRAGSLGPICGSLVRTCRVGQGVGLKTQTSALNFHPL